MKKCLIVVDVQNDFVDGALGFDGADTIETTIVHKIRSARENNHTVLFTMDTHHKDYMDSEEGKHLPVMHCVEGTHGHQLTDAIKHVQTPSDKVFIKHTFPSLELGEYLKNNPYDEIELVGLVSNICVISNAIIAKAANPNARIVVDANATKSFDPVLHEKALDVMEGLHIHIKNRG